MQHYWFLWVGSATAKGFGLALGIPIINVPTMDALAYNMFSSQYIVCPIMDARRGQVYTGIYQFEGTEMQIIKEQCIMMLEDLIEELDKTGKAVIFLGDGVEKGKEIIDAQMKSEHYYAPASMNGQKASSVAALGEIYYAQGKIEKAADHKPEYLRLSQAERELKEKLAKEKAQAEK